MKNSFIILSQSHKDRNSDNHSHPQIDNCDASQLSKKPKQLTLWESPQIPVPSAKLFRHKPQISSIPGISLKQRDRYRVMLGDEVMGDHLILDEALKLAKGGAR